MNHSEKNGSSLVVNKHVQDVLEFMQEKVPAHRLIEVAEAIPGLARLLWSSVPQEPLPILRFSIPKATTRDRESLSLSSATE